MGFQENTHREEINHGGLETLILLFFVTVLKCLGELVQVCGCFCSLWGTLYY